MKKLLLLFCTCLVIYGLSSAQDSLFYSPFWTPKHLYRQAGIRQEGVFHYLYKEDVLRDSVLLQVFLYDSLGQMVQQQDYFRNRLRTRFTYFYTGYRMDSMVQEEPWLPAALLHKYAYDSAGNMALQETFNQGKKTVQQRFVYNRHRQPVQRFTQVENGKEYLSAQYTYRPDHLVQQIDFLFSVANRDDNFSCIYTYDKAGQTATKLFQRAGNDRRFIEWKKTFNAGLQMVEKISPPLFGSAWLPPHLHSRNDEEVETSVYLPNGMVSERQRKVNDKLYSVEKHVYF